MDYVTFTPSGSVTSSVFQNERTDPSLLVAVPASLSAAAVLTLETAEMSSGGPWFPLYAQTTPPVPFVVFSGQLGGLVAVPVAGLEYLRLRSSTAIAPTSVGIALSRRP
jgi:hypothetical protein